MNKKIPRKIWAVCLQGYDSIPPMYKTSFKSWKRLNKDFALIVLTFDNILDFAEFPEIIKKNIKNIPIVAVSDILRITLLSMHGGVWTDSTVLCNLPLNYWIDDVCKNQNFFVFKKKNSDLPIASWFLAANNNCQILEIWKEYIFDYWSDILLNKKDLTQFKFGSNNYFWLHKTFKKLIEENQQFLRLFESVPTFFDDLPHIINGNFWKKSISDQQKNAIIKRECFMFKTSSKLFPDYSDYCKDFFHTPFYLYLENNNLLSCLSYWNDFFKNETKREKLAPRNSKIILFHIYLMTSVKSFIKKIEKIFNKFINTN